MNILFGIDVKKLSSLCLSLLIVALPPLAQANNEQQTHNIATQTVANTTGAVSALQTELADISSFSARFQQSTQDGLGNTLQTVTGFMQVAKPGKLRWQTEGIYEQLVISDGQSLWIYDADLEQVSIKNMDNRLSETPALLLGGDISAIDEDFIITRIAENDRLQFILQPKDSSQLFDSLELNFTTLGQDALLQQMIIRDASGQVTQISFSDILKNPSLKASLFSFNIPDGVDVIDGRHGQY